MKLGYLYMLAGLLSFSMLGIFHKIADVKRCRPSAVNALIYGWSLLFSLITVTLIQGVSVSAPSAVVWTGIPFGVFASIAILAFQAGIRHGDISTSWLAINLSSGIPTVASILIYGEPLTTRKTIALVMIPVSMTLLWIDKRRADRARAGGGDADQVMLSSKEAK
jgi:EamA domain-containing membrane protein RarD